MAAVNRHQRRDKGFGLALGPAAASGGRSLRAVGYAVVQGRIGLGVRSGRPRDPDEVLSGWASAERALTTQIIAGRDRQLARAATHLVAEGRAHHARRSRRRVRPADRQRAERSRSQSSSTSSPSTWMRVGGRESHRRRARPAEDRMPAWPAPRMIGAIDHVQAVEAAGGEEVRNRLRAAFDHDAPQAAFARVRRASRRRDVAVGRGDARSPRRPQSRRRLRRS